MNERVPEQISEPTESRLRLLVLGSLYVLALGFAVAFSPAAGLVSLQRTGEIGRIAEAPEAR
ncbi:MAG TPA: hypothetical protein VL974_15830 [Magnetospirillum sp.]|jgi:hypothetical protein|nr:hypothetical protein [Magnetospirillum sp.]